MLQAGFPGAPEQQVTHEGGHQKGNREGDQHGVEWVAGDLRGALRVWLPTVFSVGIILSLSKSGRPDGEMDLSSIAVLGEIPSLFRTGVRDAGASGPCEWEGVSERRDERLVGDWRRRRCAR